MNAPLAVAPPEAAKNLTEQEFRKLSSLIYEHCGINLHEGKKELVRARLAKRLRLCRIKTFSEYIDYALGDASGKEFVMLVDTLTTNTTSFFREAQHFEYLKEKFLPSLIQKRTRSGNKRIRVWSAGCSSGEEPYSLSITLHEALGSEKGWDVKLLATDISTRILDTCRRGIYKKERVQPVPPQLRQKYMKPTHQAGEVLHEMGPELRSIIRFRHLNLMEQWPFRGPFDFIFCRNVMIYFDKQVQAKLVNRFCDVLMPGGLLFLGHSESLTGIKHPLRYIQPTIYEKP